MLVLIKPSKLGHLSVLSIQERVPEHQLLTLQELVFIRDLRPLGSLWANASILESALVFRQLLDKRGSDFKFWPS